MRSFLLDMKRDTYLASFLSVNPCTLSCSQSTRSDPMKAFLMVILSHILSLTSKSESGALMARMMAAGGDSVVRGPFVIGKYSTKTMLSSISRPWRVQAILTFCLRLTGDDGRV